MMNALKRHLTYANVVATLALFLVVAGGVAWALENDSVRSRHIKDGQVRAADADLDDFALGEISPGDAARPLRWFHTELNTGSSGQVIELGRVNLERTAAGKFRLCAESIPANVSEPYAISRPALYNSAEDFRISDLLTAADLCAPEVNLTQGFGVEFRITALDTIIFGVPNGIGGTTTTTPRYDLYVLTSP